MPDYVVDGERKVLGRMGSLVAKQLLNGNNVMVINAEKVVISGHSDYIFAKYKRLVELKDKANPEHSPHWSRRPDLFVKRVIRGMLPYKKPKGKLAYSKLKVYIGVPPELKTKKVHDLKAKTPDQMYENSITVKELTERLGYKL
jgi:large subunit ribosomal protein L13